MKVLVTGCEGQLARSLMLAAAPASIEVAMLGRPQLDLAVPASIGPAIDSAAPDLVVNAAAYTAVDKAETEPELTTTINGTGAGLVAGACERRGIAIIHISTDYVFDGSKATPYVETDPVAPLGAYGRSKYAGEEHVAAACTRHIILRTAWVISPYGQNFVKTMLRLAATRAELGVVADQIGTPTYAPHLADAVLAIAARLASHRVETMSWGIYHAAGTGEATWCDLARETFRLSATLGGPSARVRAVTTADYPTPAKRPANSRLDCSKLASNYGVRLPDWHEGLADCVKRLFEDHVALQPAIGSFK